jgi:hypothetical protein
LAVTVRFASNLALLLLGQLLTLSAFAFGYRTVSGIALGVGCIAVLTVLGGFATAGRGSLQRGIDVLVLAGGAWTIVASRVFAGPALNKWLSVADGAMLLCLGLCGLIAHEGGVERDLRRSRGSGADGRETNGAGRGAFVGPGGRVPSPVVPERAA